MTGNLDKHALIAKERIARQRDLIARIEARGVDASEAKSLLSAMCYTLRLSMRHKRRTKLSHPAGGRFGVERIATRRREGTANR